MGFAPFSYSTKPIYKTYSEFFVSCTIPNAKCPVCGEPVFFYRSPSNGRVFFDELGPPWPKHPCTISPYTAITPNAPVNSESIDIALQYFVNSEWKPFLVEGLSKVDQKNNISEIFGYIDDYKRTFFTRLSGVTTEFPFFIKESGSEIRLLTFNPTSENYLFEFVVKKYRSELSEPMLGHSSHLPRVQALVKNRAPSNLGITKNFNNKVKSNNKKNKTVSKNSSVARPKLAGKLQDQLSKLKDSFKSK